MLVKDWMTETVITVTADTSVMKASRLMKDKVIRRLPVVDDEGKLIGIISDRDIKDASPSRATTLDMHELYYLLSEMKVRDIMTKNPVCATPEDSVEGIAHLMARQRFGGVPIVDAHKKLCGIISDSDIFKILVAVTGADCGGIQLAFELSDTPGALRPVLDALAQLDVNVVSILSAQKDKSVPTRRVFIRLHPLPDDQQKKVIEVISKEVPLLYWEPALEMSAFG